MDSIARQAKAQARIKQEDDQERLEEQARRKQFEAAGRQTASQPSRKKEQPLQPTSTEIPPNLQVLFQLSDTWVSARWVSRQTALRQMGIEKIRVILDQYAQKGFAQKQGEGKAALYRCLF